MLELLWLLLPVAAASGWWAARRTSRGSSASSSGAIRADYFRGLNYLLNEQPDKAIEVFIRMVEVDSDTVETHFALGHLFRRRGEVDRAIRIHQNLIARPTLTREQRAQALLQLGEDYMRAGLFDRAENLFAELVERNEHPVPALRHLVDIYQQEKEWEQAMESCRRLEAHSGTPMGEVIAQYYCEQAEEARARRDSPSATRLLKRALAADRNCVRASILQGRMELEGGDLRAAVRAFRRVEEQDIDYVPEVLEPLSQCYNGLGRPKAMMDYLHEIIPRYEGIAPVLALTELLRQYESDKAAADYLADQLARRPSVRGLDHLIELNLERTEGPARQTLESLRHLTRQLLRDTPGYRCRECGFTGQSMHWQCPSCKRWNTVKPVKGVAGAGPAPASSAGGLIGTAAEADARGG